MTGLDRLNQFLFFLLEKPIRPCTSLLKMKCSGLVQWEDSEGWDGEGGGKGDRDGEHV